MLQTINGGANTEEEWKICNNSSKSPTSHMTGPYTETGKKNRIPKMILSQWRKGGMADLENGSSTVS